MHGGAQWLHARKRAIGREICAAEMRERLERMPSSERARARRSQQSGAKEKVRRTPTPYADPLHRCALTTAHQLPTGHRQLGCPRTFGGDVW